MKHYSAMKRVRLFIRTTRENLRRAMLSDKSQPPNTYSRSTCAIHFGWQTCEREADSGAQALGGQRGVTPPWEDDTLGSRLVDVSVPVVVLYCHLTIEGGWLKSTLISLHYFLKLHVNRQLSHFFKKFNFQVLSEGKRHVHAQTSWTVAGGCRLTWPGSLVERSGLSETGDHEFITGICSPVELLSPAFIQCLDGGIEETGGWVTQDTGVTKQVQQQGMQDDFSQIRPCPFYRPCNSLDG